MTVVDPLAGASHDASGPLADDGSLVEEFLDSGTSTGVTPTTLEDTSKAWATDTWIGAIVTSDGKTLTVTSNTGTVLTGTAGWSPSDPASGLFYKVDKGLADDNLTVSVIKQGKSPDDIVRMTFVRFADLAVGDTVTVREVGLHNYVNMALIPYVNTVGGVSQVAGERLSETASDPITFTITQAFKDALVDQGGDSWAARIVEDLEINGDVKISEVDSDISEAAGVTLTPAPVVATFAVPTPTVVAGPVTISPAPVVATFAVPVPTVVAGPVTISPAPVVANWNVPAPTLLAVKTLAPAPVVATWGVPTPTVTAGPVTLTPAAVAASFVVPAPTLLAVKTLTPAAVVATWGVPTPTVITGAFTIQPAPTVATWAVPTPTVVTGPITLQPAPTVATWAVPTPTVVAGPVTLTPAPVVATWVVPTATIVTGANPVLVDGTADAGDIAKGNTRLAWQNPGGLKNWYRIYRDRSNFEIDSEYSTDGEDWSNTPQQVSTTVPAGNAFSVSSWAERVGSEFVIWAIYCDLDQIWYRRGTVADAANDIVWGTQREISTRSTGGLPMLAVTRTFNGRIVVAYDDLVGSLTETHFLGGSDDGDNPTWTDFTWDDAAGANNNNKADVWAALAPFTGGNGNRFVVGARLPDAVNTTAYRTVTAVPEWNGTAFSNEAKNAISSSDDASAIVSVGVDGDDRAHVLFRATTALELQSRRAGSVRDDDWDAAIDVATVVCDACTLVVDTNPSTDTLLAFYHIAADTEDFRFKTSPVDTVVWSAEQTVTYASPTADLAGGFQTVEDSLPIAPDTSTAVHFYHHDVAAATGVTLTPAPVVASFVVPTPTVIAGPVTIQPTPVVANWVVVAPTLLSPKTLTPAAVIASFVVLTPTVQIGAVTLQPPPTVASWGVPTPTLQIGAVTLTPAPTVANWVVPTPTITSGVVLSPAPVVATWVVPTPTLSVGGVTILPAPAVAAWVVPTPTLLTDVTLTPAPATAAWVVLTPTLQVGAVTLLPGAVSATWTVPAPTLLSVKILTPVAVSATWVVPVPTVQAGGVTLLPGAAVATWVVPTPSIIQPIPSTTGDLSLSLRRGDQAASMRRGEADASMRRGGDDADLKNQ